MRKHPKAKPEPNNGKKMTMVVKTRSPIEAFQMLRQGMPIDQAIGYYVKEGYLEKDVFLMDNPEKLRTLALMRELKANAKSDIDQALRQHQAEQAEKEVIN